MNARQQPRILGSLNCIPGYTINSLPTTIPNSLLANPISSLNPSLYLIAISIAITINIFKSHAHLRAIKLLLFVLNPLEHLSHSNMARHNTEELTIQLEESLGISSLENGPKLIGAVIANKMPNRGAIKNILKTAWQEFGEAKITWIRENLFAISVQDEDMARKILERGPWSVMRHCFSVRRWPLELAVEEIDTHLVPFWVQVRGIPLNLCTKDNAVKIGRKIGDLVEYENPSQARGFLRLRVEIDTTQPLPAGFWLPRSDGSETWAELQYERLSDFCYNCGNLGTVTPNAHKRKRRRELRDMVLGREPELSESCMNNPNPYRRRKVSGGRQQHQIRDESVEGGGACTRRVRAGTK
ncbi:hypothetical protein ACE6H2_002302 [Prunus campanulata]